MREIIEYVKPDAVVAAPKAANPLPTLDDPGVEAAILALPAINERTVRKAVKGSLANARILLEQLRAQGKLKTKAERLAELAPKTVDVVDVVEELPLEK